MISSSPPQVPERIWQHVQGERCLAESGDYETERLHLGGPWHGRVSLHLDKAFYFVGHPGGVLHHFPKDSHRLNRDVAERIRMTSWVYMKKEWRVDDQPIGLMVLYGYDITEDDESLVRDAADRGLKTRVIP